VRKRGHSGRRRSGGRLLGDFNCYFDYFSGDGQQADCSCAFEESECAPRAYCLSAADYPPENDCRVEQMSCEQLADGYVAPFDWLWPVTSQADSTSDLVSALGDCEEKIHTACVACQGGEGGGPSH
jgi:hypothetical protein